MKAVFYVQFKPHIRYGRIDGISASKLTAKAPTVVTGRAAVVKFTAELPESAFTPFIAEVDVPFESIEVVAHAEQPDVAE